MLNLKDKENVVNLPQSRRAGFSYRGRGSVAVGGHENAPTIQTQQLSKGAQGRVTKALQDQARLLRSQNKYTEQQIQDFLKRYKKHKI